MAGPAGPAGHHDELRATLASRGLCWGHLVCYRDLPGSPFTEGHAALMRRVAPMLGAHMRAGWRLEDAGLGGGGEPGTLVLDAGLALLSATRAALGWLEALGWPPSAGVPPFVYALAARAADIRSGVTLRIRALQGGWAKLYETDWRKLLDGFGSGVDWPVCTYYAELAAAFPAAKVVLTVRSAQAWYQSMRDTLYAASQAAAGELRTGGLPPPSPGQPGLAAAGPVPGQTGAPHAVPRLNDTAALRRLVGLPPRLAACSWRSRLSSGFLLGRTSSDDDPSHTSEPRHRGDHSGVTVCGGCGGQTGMFSAG